MKPAHKEHCTQCGGLLRGYYEFSVCSVCYTKNVNEKQKQLLAQESFLVQQCEQREGKQT